MYSTVGAALIHELQGHKCNLNLLGNMSSSLALLHVCQLFRRFFVVPKHISERKLSVRLE